MLRTVFIGSHNPFDEVLVDWLSKRTQLVGVVWTQSTLWQDTWDGRLAFARQRLRRYGLIKMLDETLFYLHYHRFVYARDNEDLRRQVIEPYWVEHGPLRWTGESIMTMDINSARTVAFLTECQPDATFAMCINNYFGKKVRSIPHLGTFLWHEGITPAYKGLYSPFWAVHNLDFDNIGYTLLRMNESIDAGEVFVQGQAVDVDPHRYGHGYVGHKAIIDSLPAVEKFLVELEAGVAKPIYRPGASSHYYTYPGLSDLVRQKVRLWRRATAPPPSVQSKSQT